MFSMNDFFGQEGEIIWPRSHGRNVMGELIEEHWEAIMSGICISSGVELDFGDIEIEWDVPEQMLDPTAFDYACNTIQYEYFCYKNGLLIDTFTSERAVNYWKEEVKYDKIEKVERAYNSRIKNSRKLVRYCAICGCTLDDPYNYPRDFPDKYMVCCCCHGNLTNKFNLPKITPFGGFNEVSKSDLEKFRIKPEEKSWI